MKALLVVLALTAILYFTRKAWLGALEGRALGLPFWRTYLGLIVEDVKKLVRKEKK